MWWKEMEDHIQFFDGPSEVSFRREGPLLHHFRSTSITKDQELLEVGKNEEQLPQPTVGRLSADCRLPPFTKIFCQQSADCWQHVGNLLAACR